jgi:hypothetical protein
MVLQEGFQNHKKPKPDGDGLAGSRESGQGEEKARNAENDGHDQGGGPDVEHFPLALLKSFLENQKSLQGLAQKDSAQGAEETNEANE